MEDPISPEEAESRGAMSPPGPAGEWRRFAERLNASTFRPLSTGLGLGSLRPSERRSEPLSRAARAPAAPGGWGSATAHESSAPPAKPSHQRPAPGRRGPEVQSRGPSSQPQSLSRPVRGKSGGPHSVGPRTASQPSRSSRGRQRRETPPAQAVAVGWERRLLAWSLDVVIVVGALVGALIGVGFLRGDPGHGWGFAMISWLGELNPWALVIAAHGVLILYAVLFRVVAGRTLGECAVRIPGRVSHPSAATRPG